MTKHQQVELLEDLPPGTYQAAIMTVPEVEEFGKESWEYFRAEFQITSGEHEWQTVTYSAPFKEQVTKRSRLGQLIKSILPEHTPGKVEFNEMLQKPCEIICEDDSEGPEFLHKLEKSNLRSLTKLAMKLMLLTFVRTQELINSEWSEFEILESNPVWRIPAERMKMKAQHLVPLSTQAIEILNQIKSYSGSGRYVFPHCYNSDKTMSNQTLLKALTERLGYSGKATVHGFRSTFSTVLNETGNWNPDAIERQLSHIEKNKVRDAYNRVEYLPDRREMMQWWADYLDKTQQSIVRS